LLLEVIIPANMESSVTTVASAIRRLYEIGLRPDWWKLEPAADPEAWRQIEAAVTQSDPLCRGVVLLGLSAPEAELVSSFAAAAPFNIVKGFAVGRTIFHEAAREWFAGRISDDEAVAALAGKMSALVAAWRKARASAEGTA
jgi:5-dehydro-2-deoxygluconokinase